MSSPVLARPELELGLLAQLLPGVGGHARRAPARAARAPSAASVVIPALASRSICVAVEPGDAREVVDARPSARRRRGLKSQIRQWSTGQRLGRRRVGDEALEPRADAPVVGAELARPERRLLARAEQHVDPLRLAALEPRELLVVEAELEDVRRLRVRASFVSSAS